MIEEKTLNEQFNELKFLKKKSRTGPNEKRKGIKRFGDSDEDSFEGGYHSEHSSLELQDDFFDDDFVGPDLTESQLN